MKIAMFTDSYYPTVDGVVNSVSIVSRELEKIGHEVMIFAPESADGQKVDDITRGGTFLFKSFKFRHYPQYRTAFLPSKKTRMVRELGVDIIHTHGITTVGLKGLRAAKQFDVPVATTYHTMVHEAMNYYKPVPVPTSIIVNLAVRYMRFFLTKANAVVAPTRSILEELVKIAPRMPYATVIPTGVDTRRFYPSMKGDNVRERYGIGDNPLLLYVGRVAYEKNIDSIIRNIPGIRDRNLKMLIVGEGPARRELELLVRSLNLQDRVIFTGFVPDDELIDYYSAADAFVSASKFETQGISMLEAMSCGKPVVSINFRASADFIVSGVNGFLYDDDRGNMAETIMKAIHADPHISRNARRTAEIYSKENCARSLSQLYSKLVRMDLSR
ncbi:MAG: glycosyltransferase [Candidatus Thermoplasmatota archaeon]|jgi:1,2-diacylglycerol 3-alpha-glucosyltransferase|nr:glycosyltransferase [Candidatus Sysuiplasma jiujiangense]MBX8639365.1 glycosyltransferase [Candidatus Sysuiplasma jiujiangense]MBX8642421.1 glycosyltransferase [Candidatus Sysuiplasma jiujiangense]MCL4316684.1 glycosyltransferase [Candidatus Thermoplasmatota archaeon]